MHSSTDCSGQAQEGLSSRLFFLSSQILKLELKKHTESGSVEGTVEVVSLEIFRRCYEKGRAVQAVRDLESTLQYLSQPAHNQGESKQKACCVFCFSVSGL